VHHDDVLAYLRGPFQQVGGWCSPWLWQLITPLAERQAALGCHAPVAEIGVYHGKFFLGLVKTKGAPAHNHAIDVFDMQQFNLDGAGKGDMEQFRANIEKVGLAPGAVTMLRADSMTLGTAEIARIREDSGGFSLFSVDGCHMVEHTINDVRVAMQLTLPEGIIFVDDYTNQDWPGVQEGIAKLYLMDSPRFVPLAVLHNKLFLCHISHHAAYLKHIQAAAAKITGARTKLVQRFGYPSLNLFPATASGDAYLG
jgi:hypothetical protein